jgi:ATP-binding cassette subfamily F protein uup
METLDVLEAMVGDYPGTVLLISHDRDFLDRLVSSVVVPEGDGRWTEYAGGYTDMLAQRGSDLARAARPDRGAKTSAGSRNTPVSSPPPKKRRMTFNDKHALETLPKAIATLEAQVRALQQQFDDPSFFTRDRAGFEQASRSLGEAQAQLSDAEDRWLELEILREELSAEGGS